MDLTADWNYITEVADIRRGQNQTYRHVNVRYFEVIGAAGELAARRFLGLPERLHLDLDGGTDFLWRGYHVDVKTTRLTPRLNEWNLQWPEQKPLNPDIILLLAVDQKRRLAVPIGYATRREMLDAQVNQTRHTPCREIHIRNLHPIWQLYMLRPKRGDFPAAQPSSEHASATAACACSGSSSLARIPVHSTAPTCTTSSRAAPAAMTPRRT